MNIALLSEYLETYPGRDKILRTLSYAAKLATVVTPSEQLEIKFKTFSSQMSNCRVILRLLDDIPALHNAITYAQSNKDPDRIIRYVELIETLVDLIYNPIEHISWAGEHNIVKINTSLWDNITTWFWIISLYLSLIKSLRKLNKLDIRTVQTNKKIQNDGNAMARAIHIQHRNELLTCLRLVLDISYAVSYLPPGTLWGGYLKTWQVGALGTVSSCIGLYQALKKQVDRKKLA